MTELEALQRWMLQVVTHVNGLEAGLRETPSPGGTELTAIVPGNERLSAEDQLQIYAYAYQERLREVLASESPTVEHLLGAERFAELARHYLADHPPHSFTLDHLGADFAPWLSAHDDPLLQAAADMVRVEQAMDRSFDAAPQARADPQSLATLPPEAWADARLVFRSGLELLALDHDVMDAMTAAKQGVTATPPPRHPTWVAAYTRDVRRFRMGLERHEHALATALQGGAPLGDALEQVATQPGVDLDQLLPAVRRWFQRWMEAGWIVEVARTPGP